MKPRMKNHFRAHQLSVWLRLIPELHRAGMEDVMLRHNLFRNHDDADLYEGVVRPDPLSRRAPQRATVNRFTANGTVAEVVQSLTTTGRPQWPAESSSTCVPPPARGGPNAAAANASTATATEDALATLGAAGYAAYVTALHVTIALGVSLLVLNGLLLVIICYQKDRFKCLQQQQQQQTGGGGSDGGQEAVAVGGGGGDSHTQKIAAAVRYKTGAAVTSDDRPPMDKTGGGYDHHQHHNHHHNHQQQQQQQQQMDAVTVEMEQRQLHHHHHHHHLQQQQQQQYHHHQQTGAAAVRSTTGGGHDMTFPRAAVKPPSGRTLHDQHVVHMQGGPPNGSLLVHGTLPKPPPPPRSAVQSQESQPLLVQQGVGLGQMPKSGGSLKMPVAAMSEMRV